MKLSLSLVLSVTFLTACVNSPPSYHTDRQIIQANPSSNHSLNAVPHDSLNNSLHGDLVEIDGVDYTIVTIYTSALGQPCFGLVSSNKERQVVCKGSDKWYIEAPLLKDSAL